MNSQKPIDFEVSFIVTLLGIISLITIGYLLKVNNVLLLLITSIIVITLCLLSLYKNTSLTITKFEVIILLFFIAISLINFYYHHENLLNSRDESAYTNSAIFLANNNVIRSDDLLIKSFYGFETNSPINTLSKFLPGYIVFLSLFIKLFSIRGISIADSLLLFLSLVLLLKIKNKLFLGSAKNKFHSLLLLVFSINFLFLWFFRRTVSENLGFIILWSIFYFLLIINSRRKIDSFTISSLVILFTSFLLTRPEFSLFLFSLIASIAFIFRRDLKLKINSKFNFLTIISFILLISPLILYLLLKIPDYNLLFKAFFRNLISLFNPNISYFGKYSLIFMFQSMNLFFPIMFFISLLGFFVFLRKPQTPITLLLIFFSPILIIMVVHSITPDFPWFFRRFYWHLVPISFFFFLLFFNKLNYRHRIFIASIFVLTTFLISYPIMFYSDGNGSADMIKDISNQLPNNSLSLIMNERVPSPNFVNNGLQNIAAPIYFLGGKQSAIAKRLFDLDDHEEKINQYNDFVVITSNMNISEISNLTNLSNLKYLKTKYYEIPILANTCEIYWPLILPSEIEDKIFRYSEIQAYCFKDTPKKINSIKLNISIYGN